MKLWIFGLLLILNLVYGCVANNVITPEEIKTQNKAAHVVSGVLFDNDIDDSASYNIRKNGLVVIRFDESVSERSYTDVVNMLRSSPDINGVQAEQGGIEVCPLQ